jgi:hypothetical protein
VARVSTDFLQTRDFPNLGAGHASHLQGSGQEPSHAFSQVFLCRFNLLFGATRPPPGRGTISVMIPYRGNLKVIARSWLDVELV